MENFNNPAPGLPAQQGRRRWRPSGCARFHGEIDNHRKYEIRRFRTKNRVATRGIKFSRLQTYFSPSKFIQFRSSSLEKGNNRPARADYGRIRHRLFYPFLHESGRDKLLAKKKSVRNVGICGGSIDGKGRERELRG